ncbi:MAG: thioredoxin TrxA, partial [Methylococcales bacterium]
PFFRIQSRRRRQFKNNLVEKSVSDVILSVTDDNFEDIVLKSERPVLVDYWAEWCGPCKMIAPILDKIADEFLDILTVAKLNIDDNQKTPQRYGVRGIPTLMLFKNGEVQATKVGVVSDEILKKFINKNI